MLKILGIVPFASVLIVVIYCNRVTPLILGLPAFLAWLLFCILLTSAVMAVIFFCDPANRRIATGAGPHR